MRQYQGSSHYLTGGSIPPLFTLYGYGGVKTGKVILIYKCNKYPEHYSVVVQLVEQWAVNPYVVGSSPTHGATPPKTERASIALPYIIT